MYNKYIIKIYNPIDTKVILWESKIDTFENILKQFQTENKNSIISLQTFNNIRLKRNKKDTKYIEIIKVSNNKFDNEKIFKLRDLCRKYEIGHSGNKSVLSEKLQKIFPYIKKSTKELRRECQDKFLKFNGNRNTLLKRLINIQTLQTIKFITNKDQLDKIVQTCNHTVILIIAKWCKKSKLIIPKITKLSRHFKNINFFFLNAENDSCTDIIDMFDNTPSILFYKKNQLYKSIDCVTFNSILSNIDMKKTILSLFKDLNCKSKSELITLCKKNKLLEKGLKYELIDRLIQFYKN